MVLTLEGSMGNLLTGIYILLCAAIVVGFWSVIIHFAMKFW